MYYYIYIIKFNSGQFYIGSRQSKVEPEKDTKYLGSPKTYKHLWEDNSLEKTKHIIKVCSSFEKMRDLEVKLIKEAWDKYPDECLNRNAAPVFHPEIYSKAGKIGGNISKNNKLGIHALTFEERSKNGQIAGKIGGKRCHELGIGAFSITLEKRKEISNECKEKEIGIYGLSKERKIEIGKKCEELKLGIHSLTTEDRQKIGKRNAENKVGIHGFSKEQRKEISNKQAETFSKEFVIKSPDGEIFHAKNLREFCRKNNLDRKCINCVLKGTSRQHKGWTLP